MSATRDDSLDTLVAELRGSIEALAEALLGAPNRRLRRKNELSWGRKGSKGVIVDGPERGTWNDRAANIGGGPLQLVMHARSCSFAEAITWARGWLGTPERDRPAPAPTPAPAAEDAFDADDLAAIGEAKKVVFGSRGLHGTLAERYLAGTRGIPRPDGGWPSALSFHRGDPELKMPYAGAPSLVLAATTDDGAVQAIQRVVLDSNAKKLAPFKPTAGRMKGAVVRLPGPADGPLLIAEGPETGLSVWRATGHPTWIALGSVAHLKVDLPRDRRVVVCADDDPRHAPAAQALRKALKKWKHAGLDVVKATPWPVARQDKSDFNDVIREAGLDAVRQRVDRVLVGGKREAKRVTVDEARQRLGVLANAFFNAAFQHHHPGPDAGNLAGLIPPVQAVKVTVGGGKSGAAIAPLDDFIQRMVAANKEANATIKAANDAARKAAKGSDAPAQTQRLKTAQTATILTSTLALADDLADRVRAKHPALSVAVWRGMEADDPDEPGEKMCQNLEAVKEARAVMADPETSVCRKRSKDGTPDKVCPFFETCGYQNQKTVTADVWLGAHGLLFHDAPRPMQDMAALVVDESPVSAGIEGLAEHDKIEMPLDWLTTARDGDGVGGQRLRFLRGLAADALRQHADGPLRAEALIDAGLTDDAAAEAHGLEWQRKVDPNLVPGMDRRRWLNKVRAASENRSVRPMATFWAEARNLLQEGIAVSGRVEILTTVDGHRAIRIRRKRTIPAAWRVPTLVLDATLNPDLLRPWWPQVEQVADIEISAPHQRVRQVVDRAFPLSLLKPLDEEQAATQPEEARKRERALGRLHAVLQREARRYAPGRVLVVAQKAVREALETRFQLRSNIVMRHHNSVRGLDGWGDVRAVIAVGRTQPPPHSVEHMAGAMTGTAPIKLDGYYPKADADREMADGNLVAAEADRHPDPMAEALRWQACEGELVQIIGRGRGVNRTADNPLDVVVLTDVPLPLPVNELLSDADLDPSPVDRMLAVGGVAFMEPAHASRAYPELWNTGAAARMAFNRSEVANKPVYEVFHTEMFASSGRVRFQLTGAGQRPAEAIVALDRVPDPRGWLEARLGTLAIFEVLDVPQVVETDHTTSTTTPVPLDPHAGDSELPEATPETTEIPIKTMTTDDLMDPADVFELGLVTPVAEHVFRVGNRPIIVPVDARPSPIGDPRAGDLAIRIARAMTPARVGFGCGEPVFRTLEAV